jgi:hypothetical protein
MKKISKKIKIFFFFLLSVLAFAQTLSSNLSKEKIALGEKATLRISINNLRGRDVISKPKNELLPFHFEETKDDITKTFDNYSRTIEFQIFDEGKYTIPPLEFSINGEVLKTIPYEITVYNPVNADEQISDIMNNKQVELGWKDYWEMYKWYVLGAFIVIALLFVFLGMFKNGVFGKNNKEKPSIHKTLLDLKNLEKKNYRVANHYRP